MTQGVIASLPELIALRQQAAGLQIRSASAFKHTGNHHARQVGPGMLFSEVRNYQAGDDIRHMEWRVTARTGRPHVKLYEEEKERPVMLAAGFQPSMYFGTRTAFKSVAAARLCALAAWVALSQGDRAGGLFYGPDFCKEFMPRGREKALMPLLSFLCEATGRRYAPRTAGFTLKEVLPRLNRVMKTGGTVILISDFYDLDALCEPELRRLQRKNKLIACQMLDVLEQQAPKPGLYPVTDSSHALLLDISHAEVAENYQAWCDARKALVQSFFKKLRIPLIQLTPADDLKSGIRQIFGGQR